MFDENFTLKSLCKLMRLCKIHVRSKNGISYTNKYTLNRLTELENHLKIYAQTKRTKN